MIFELQGIVKLYAQANLVYAEFFTIKTVDWKSL